MNQLTAPANLTSAFLHSLDPERTKRGSFVAMRRLGPTARREM
jgi:hypothetical protein